MDELERLKTTDGVRDAFTKAKVVFADDKHTFNHVADEARSGGDTRINVSKVAIDFGNSRRGRKVYVDRSGKEALATGAESPHAHRYTPAAPISREELEQMRNGDIPNTEPPLPARTQSTGEET
jgi:hypothetical protein